MGARLWRKPRRRRGCEGRGCGGGRVCGGRGPCFSPAGENPGVARGGPLRLPCKMLPQPTPSRLQPVARCAGSAGRAFWVGGGGRVAAAGALDDRLRTRRATLPTTLPPRPAAPPRPQVRACPLRWRPRRPAPPAAAAGYGCQPSESRAGPPSARSPARSRACRPARGGQVGRSRRRGTLFPPASPQVARGRARRLAAPPRALSRRLSATLRMGSTCDLRRLETLAVQAPPVRTLAVRVVASRAHRPARGRGRAPRARAPRPAARAFRAAGWAAAARGGRAAAIGAAPPTNLARRPLFPPASPLGRARHPVQTRP